MNTIELHALETQKKFPLFDRLTNRKRDNYVNISTPDRKGPKRHFFPTTQVKVQ